MMRVSDAPAARAASTNSFSFSDSTKPRMMRATGIQKNSDEDDDGRSHALRRRP